MELTTLIHPKILSHKLLISIIKSSIWAVKRRSVTWKIFWVWLGPKRWSNAVHKVHTWISRCFEVSIEHMHNPCHIHLHTLVLLSIHSKPHIEKSRDLRWDGKLHSDNHYSFLLLANSCLQKSSQLSGEVSQHILMFKSHSVTWARAWT